MNLIVEKIGIKQWVIRNENYYIGGNFIYRFFTKAEAESFKKKISVVKGGSVPYDKNGKKLLHTYMSMVN